MQLQNMTGLNDMQLTELVARVRAGTGELVSRGRGFSLDLQHPVALVAFLLQPRVHPSPIAAPC